MWYKVFIDDDFLNYFSNDDNVFYTVEGDEEILAHMFSRFRDVLEGATYAWTLPNISLAHAREAMENASEDLVRSFIYCRENFPKNRTENIYDILNSIPIDSGESRYDTDVEKLSAEQCAVLLMYPFWSGMGGSFETYFQEDGRLKKYLLALKKKVDELEQAQL